MVTTQILPADVLTALAAQLGERPSFELANALNSAESAEIGESFPVYLLPDPGAEAAGAELDELAIRTGQWHHQIRMNSEPTSFARSRSLGAAATDWRVEEVVESAVATAIDAAVSWLDENEGEEGEVRLLVVPAFYLHAFWIKNEARPDRVLIVDCPAGAANLEPLQLMVAQAFVSELAGTPRAQGIPELRYVEEEPPLQS